MKAFWKSKTLWFNVISAAVALGSGGFGIVIDPTIAVPIVTIGNALLRLITSQGIVATDQPAP